MNEEETETCPNCKREIPVVNFVIHSVHCARNIRMCPVCKEPVLQGELQEHHDQLHKLMPCKQCGESVCGTDLEDHIRDSCGHTIRSCRYCELELPRRELPAHEGYCGVRTEQCSECREWVMIKYRQLHLDSNHGFLRLDDDPVPQPKKEIPKPTFKSTNFKPANSNGIPKPITDKKNINQNGPRTEIRYFNGPNYTGDSGSSYASRFNLGSNSSSGPSNTGSTSTGGLNKPGSSLISGQSSSLTGNATGLDYNASGSTNAGPSNGLSSGSNHEVSSNVGGVRIKEEPSETRAVRNVNGTKAVKRTNDQPQAHAAVNHNRVHNNIVESRGAVKKRPAPKPPVRDPSSADPRRDLALHSALLRQQREDRKRQEQTAHNLARGLPPALSPAAKLEKLRKMDALHNREVEDKDYKNRLQGRVWMDHSMPAGHVLGRSTSQDSDDLDAELTNQNMPVLRNIPEPVVSEPSNIPERRHVRNDLRDLQPMTPHEFMQRFNELQLRREDTGNQTGNERTQKGDRFSEIKSSLRELRRGLNEVTAPYNSNANNNRPQSPTVSPLPSPQRSPLAPPLDEGPDVRLPCEFCDTLVPAEDLVLHQTGCRPDLTRYQPASRPPLSTPPPLYEDPVIPCEFCNKSLPVYLITEHQEQCRQEHNLLYPD